MAVNARPSKHSRGVLVPVEVSVALQMALIQVANQRTKPGSGQKGGFSGYVNFPGVVVCFSHASGGSVFFSCSALSYVSHDRSFRDSKTPVTSLPIYTPQTSKKSTPGV
ncbi:hypothetical protein B0H13DRAFT_1850073 [Mycena leptocephala]|nr:hypothetical protein B0H13DRAFT_1850073 [Mycena leptocephala]